MLRNKDQWGDAVAGAAWAELVPPAPGDLRIVQAFINSADLGPERRDLDSPRALADYLARWNLLPPSQELDADDLERAVAVREGLRTLLRGNVGKAIDRPAVDRLDRTAAEVNLRLRSADLDARLEPAADGLDGRPRPPVPDLRAGAIRGPLAAIQGLAPAMTAACASTTPRTIRPAGSARCAAATATSPAPGAAATDDPTTGSAPDAPQSAQKSVAVGDLRRHQRQQPIIAADSLRNQ